MCAVLRVRWTLAPRFAPRPWIICSPCGLPRPHVASGKFRLNANGKKLDAWMIYRCAVCGRTWNRPIFDRRPVRSVSSELLEKLQTNDDLLAREHAFDIDALRRLSPHIDVSDAVDIEKSALNAISPECSAIEIKLVSPQPTSLRLDRCLATGLGIARSQLVLLHDRKLLKLDPYRKNIFRKPVIDGQRVTMNLQEMSDRAALLDHVLGQ